MAYPSEDAASGGGPHANDVRLRVSSDANSIRSRRSTRSSAPDEPPRFTIDLSLPPEQRYVDVCVAFKTDMLNLTSLFDEVVGGMVPYLPLKGLHLLCKLFLRQVYNSEENAELKGISQATGVGMYLLVCFNVLLDLFMGCSSGGAVVRSGTCLRSGSKMVHFRTLDWGMDDLRRVVVQLDFVLQKDGPVIASSITYAGFVGVLTGVRKDLSMSLNFRPNRVDKGQTWSDTKYGWHLLMVLLGRRSSISTDLRQCLLSRSQKNKTESSWLPFKTNAETDIMDYSDIIKRFGGENEKPPPIITTPCYLCFSNGKETTVIEKDRGSAKVRSSTEFIVVTNADDEIDSNDHTEMKNNAVIHASMQEIVEEAKDREQCARDNWAKRRAAKLRRLGYDKDYNGEKLASLMETDDIVELVQRYPTVNECTHFACVLDPAEGKVKWCRRWMQPVTDRWIKKHMSETG